jgi:hypothetical protein
LPDASKGGSILSSSSSWLFGSLGGIDLDVGDDKISNSNKITLNTLSPPSQGSKNYKICENANISIKISMQQTWRNDFTTLQYFLYAKYWIKKF